MIMPREKRSPRISFRATFPEVSDQFAAEIGKIVTNWVIVEGYCSFIIGLLVDLPSDANLGITAELTHLQRVNIISSLMYSSRHPELIYN